MRKDVGITCPPLPKNKVHATHELAGEWQAGADIQAVYCDRRWQAGFRSGATSLFDVGRFRQSALADSMLDVHLSKQPEQV